MAARTRARQSLIDFSLEELEQMLELDAEDAAAAEDAEYEQFIQVRGKVVWLTGWATASVNCA